MKLVFVLLFSVAIFAQDAKESLYSRGLRACVEKEIQEYSKFSDRDLRNVIVLKNSQLTDKLPPQLGEIKIQYLDNSELAQIFKLRPKNEKKLRDAIPVIEIYPLFDEGDKLFFAYANFWFRYAEKGGWFSRKRIIYGLSLEGGCRAEIRFDPAEKRFQIEQVKLWGI